MADTTLTPDECQLHAKACRDMARTETNPETRKRLEDVATAWEQICEQLGDIAKRKQN
jgi:hypothetical protein